MENCSIAGKLIGCIVRDEIFAELSLECNAIRLTSSNEKEVLTGEPLDLLLYQSPPLKKYDDIETLTSLCKRRKIPCVYWDTDGLVIFAANLQSIRLFDYVFTTDKALIEKYKSLLCHNRVFHLPKAVPPIRFNEALRQSAGDCELKTQLYSAINARRCLGRLQQRLAGLTQHNNELDILAKSCDEDISKSCLVAIRNAYACNTYGDLIVKLLKITGVIKNCPEPDGVSVIAIAKSSDEVEAVVSNYERQAYPVKELIIAACENCKNTSHIYNNHAMADEIAFLEACGSSVEILNKAVKLCRYKYISVFEINNCYCRNFLSDLMLCFKYTDADIAGKGEYYCYDKAADRLALNNLNGDYCYTQQIAPYSGIIKKNVFDKIKFDGKSADIYSNMVGDAINSGFTVFSADRYNYAKSCVQCKQSGVINLSQWLKSSPLPENEISFISKISF